MNSTINNQYRYNHVIQKAFCQPWADENGNIYWMKHGTNEKGKFNINDKNKNHPIAEEYFYSEEIEKGMNELESDGISIIRKIIDYSKSFEKKIQLTRKELIILKYFVVMSQLRTSKFRKNISNKDGDWVFNDIVKLDGRDPKELHEESIKYILEGYKKTKISNYLLTMNFECKNIWRSCSMSSLVRIFDSRLLIFKFEENNLMLPESLGFTEQKEDMSIMLNFIPISPNIGICFFHDPFMTKFMTKLLNVNQNYKEPKSRIFTNNIPEYQHEVKYFNHKKIEEQWKYLDFNFKFMDKKDVDSWHVEFQNLFENEDKFIYDFIEEPKEISILCNAMSLVHINNSVLIYKDEKDVNEAEMMKSKKNIVRIEDINSKPPF